MFQTRITRVILIQISFNFIPIDSSRPALHLLFWVRDHRTKRATANSPTKRIPVARAISRPSVSARLWPNRSSDGLRLKRRGIEHFLAYLTIYKSIRSVHKQAGNSRSTEAAARDLRLAHSNLIQFSRATLRPVLIQRMDPDDMI